MIARRSLLAGASIAAGTSAWAAAATGASAAAAASKEEPDTVSVPRMDVLKGSQADYLPTLLDMALARSGRRYRLTQTPSTMVQSRSLIELARPEAPIDVFWTMTDPERESHLLPVRIPVDRGLLGWRIALVRHADRQRWKALRKLAELARYSAGQMHDWPDTAILRANGLTVHTSPSYPGLFDMLALGRIDYFPRSLLEIGGELEARKHLDIAIEPHVLLHYPAAMYYFVKPTRPRLAADLERGLEALLADGSLERLFQQQYGHLLASYQLDKRVVLTLRNPVLPPATPVQRKALWWTPKGSG